jgi:hypothetical protein
MNAVFYSRQLHLARQRYAQTGNRDAYFADCVYIAMKIAADKLAEENPRLAYLPASIAMSQHAIKGLTDVVSHLLHCPVSSGHDHEDFLSAWYNHSWQYLDHDTPESVRHVLTYMGIWRH